VGELGRERRWRGEVKRNQEARNRRREGRTEKE